MKEKVFYPKLRRWLKKYWPYTGAYEVKLTKEKSLPFSSLSPHQERALNLVKHGRFTHKLPDDTIGHKPFDVFALCCEGAYIVVFFIDEKKPRGYLIDIDQWRREKKASDRKSITEKKCNKLKMGKVIHIS